MATKRKRSSKSKRPSAAAAWKQSTRNLRIYLVNRDSDEVVAIYGLSKLGAALKEAKTEGWQVVFAPSLGSAEDIATGTKPGPMFSPGKLHRRLARVGARTVARRTSRNPTSPAYRASLIRYEDAYRAYLMSPTPANKAKAIAAHKEALSHEGDARMLMEWANDIGHQVVGSPWEDERDMYWRPLALASGKKRSSTKAKKPSRRSTKNRRSSKRRTSR